MDTPTGVDEETWLTPRTITVLFVLVGSLWIVLSDWAVTKLFGFSPLSAQAQLVKGLLFVAGSGLLIYVLVSHREDRIRRREHRLQESERQLALEQERIEAVVENAPLVLTVLDSDGTITVSEGRQLERIGLEPGELEGQTVTEAFGDLPEILDNAERVLDGESFWTETRVGDRHLEAWHQPVVEDGAVDHAIIIAQDVTERKRQEERFQAFVEQSSDIIIVLDEEGVVEYVSPSVERILGYEESVFLDEDVFEFVHPANRERVVEAFDRLRTGSAGETVAVQFRIRAADDSWRWAEARGTARSDLAQDDFVVNVRDVTDRVEADQELRRLDESRSLALNAANAGVWDWDVTTDEVSWHESCEQLFGLEPGTFEGSLDAVMDRVHPADRQSVDAAIQQALDERELFQHTHRIVRDDGGERWVESRGTILLDDQGEPARMLGTVLDITERVRRERELEQYETIVETAAEPIYALDSEGTVTLANEAFAAATGLSKDALLGTNITTLLESDDVEESLDHIESLTGEGPDPGPLKLALEGKRGERQFEVNIAAVDDPEGDDVPGTVGVAHDVTELQNRLTQLRVMERVLRHNLRNDMSVIRGNAESIELAADGEVAGLASKIVAHSDRLLTLTEKQQDITKLLSSEPALETFDAVAVIDRVVQSFSTESPAVQVQTDLPDRLCLSATTGFPTAIEELLENAYRHTDRERPEIQISAASADGVAEISIADNGRGIPEMDRRVVEGDHEIEPLFHGEGLGLWLVSWIVRRSNGTISFENLEPRGTAITMTFPRAQSDGTDQPP